MSNSTKVAVLAAVLSLMAWPVVAQQPQEGQKPAEQAAPMRGPEKMRGPGMGHGMSHGMGHGMGHGMMMHMGHGPMCMGMGGPGEYIEGRLAFLKAELRITPQQESVWNTYAQAMRASASAMQARHDQMKSREDRPRTLPERLQSQEEMLSAHLEQLKSMRAAAVPLYNALSAEQKGVADKLLGTM